MRKIISRLGLLFCVLILFSGCTNESFYLDANIDNNDDINIVEENIVEENIVEEKITEEKVYEDEEKYIIFGSYEQDNDITNGAEKIEWIQLDERNDEILLVSRYILDYKDFNDTTIAKGTSWENSTLRKWLNENFYNSSFSAEEKKRIINSNIQDYRANDELGNKIVDKVFILNKKQVFEYFDEDKERATISTNYAETQKSYVTDSYWLINSYSSDLYKCLINAEGKNENNPRVNESEGVRPAIWIKK